MIRKARRHEIYRCNPWFFWQECCNCGQEFRREKGWRAFTGPFIGGVGVFRYICASCAPSRDHAEIVMDGLPWIPKRPAKAPIAPPRIQ